MSIQAEISQNAFCYLYSSEASVYSGATRTLIVWVASLCYIFSYTPSSLIWTHTIARVCRIHIYRAFRFSWPLFSMVALLRPKKH